nr:hypothetical protein [Tanacetum cinerariifolium]
QNQGDVNDAMKSKKKAVMITFDPLALVVEQTNVSKRKEKVVATSSANKKQEYVKSDDKKEEKKVDEKKRDMSKVKCYNYSEASSSSSDDKIAEVSYYTSESESESEYETSDYSDNSTTYGLFVDNNDDQEIFHDSSEFFFDNLIESQIDHNESDATHNDSKDVSKKQIADQEILFDKMSRQLAEFDENETSSLKPYVPNAILEKIIIDLEDEVVSLLDK